MPERGKLPKWEREGNRTRIFITLFEKPLGFTELLKETELARSTLSQHLKDLQQQQVIEKAIENGKVVYRTTMDENKIMDEFKRATFDAALIYLAREVHPSFVMLVETYLKAMIKTIVYRMKEEAIEGKRPTLKEMGNHFFRVVFSEMTPEKLELLGLPQSEWDQLVAKTLLALRRMEEE